MLKYGHFQQEGGVGGLKIKILRYSCQLEFEHLKKESGLDLNSKLVWLLLSALN